MPISEATFGILDEFPMAVNLTEAGRDFPDQ
jgi:hypothetical protein